MLDFIVHPAFKFFVFPVTTALVGAALNFASRNDQFAKLKKEDFAVGLGLALTACLMFVVLTTDRAAQLLRSNKELELALKQTPLDARHLAQLQGDVQKFSEQIATSGWLIALMFLGLFSISVVVRKLGWRGDTEMDTSFGIVLPMVFGILCMLGVMAAAS